MNDFSLLLLVSGQVEHTCHSQRVLLEIQSEREGAKKVRASSEAREQREKMKHFLVSLTEYMPPKSYAGVHLCHVLQVPDLMDIIVREFECRRHVLRPGERPNLKVLGLRYGVSEEAIRHCNGLQDCSLSAGIILCFDCTL